MRKFKVQVRQEQINEFIFESELKSSHDAAADLIEELKKDPRNPKHVVRATSLHNAFHIQSVHPFVTTEQEVVKELTDLLDTLDNEQLAKMRGHIEQLFATRVSQGVTLNDKELDLLKGAGVFPAACHLRDRKGIRLDEAVRIVEATLQQGLWAQET